MVVFLFVYLFCIKVLITICRRVSVYAVPQYLVNVLLQSNPYSVYVVKQLNIYNENNNLLEYTTLFHQEFSSIPILIIKSLVSYSIFYAHATVQTDL